MNGGVLSDPVTNFGRSNLIYAKAMAHNKGLDRDKDKIRLREGVAGARGCGVSDGVRSATWRPTP